MTENGAFADVQRKDLTGAICLLRTSAGASGNAPQSLTNVACLKRRHDVHVCSRLQARCCRQHRKAHQKGRAKAFNSTTNSRSDTTGHRANE